MTDLKNTGRIYPEANKHKSKGSVNKMGICLEQLQCYSLDFKHLENTSTKQGCVTGILYGDNATKETKQLITCECETWDNRRQAKYVQPNQSKQEYDKYPKEVLYKLKQETIIMV